MFLTGTLIPDVTIKQAPEDVAVLDRMDIPAAVRRAKAKLTDEQVTSIFEQTSALDYLALTCPGGVQSGRFGPQEVRKMSANVQPLPTPTNHVCAGQRAVRRSRRR